MTKVFNYFTDVVGTGTRTCSHREGDLFGIEVRKQSDVPARPGLIGRLAAASALFCLSPALPAAIQFTDVTAGSGTAYTGESYGSSWGDFNSDGLPDLFVSHHRAPPGLYINLGDGTFEDRSFAVDVWQAVPNADQHGAAWSDFDNDGDNDLFVTVGAKNNSQFLVHNGTFLSNATDQYTFDVKGWGGRMPVWFDFSGDGLLDFAIAVQGQGFHLHEQRAGDFIRVNQTYGNNCTDNDFGQLADVTRDQILDWICVAQEAFPQRIYDITAKPFFDRTSLIPQVPNNIDSAFADFDGDLVSDGLAVRGRARVNGAEITGPNEIEAHIIDNGISQTGFSFTSGGTVSFELHWNARNVGNIFIGASGTHPGPSDNNGVIRFTLSPSDPDVAGMRALDSNPGKDSLFVGFDPATQRWQFWSVSAKWNYTYTFVDSTQPVSNLSLYGLGGLDMPRTPTLYLSGSGSYVDRTSFANLGAPLPCIGVAAADFDNDMDVDLFFVCRNAVSNAPDRLFENLGNGSFASVTSAGGAQGPTGPGVGLGENVTAADYDVDGFVDLFVNNGLALFPEMPYSNGGPDKLYRNLGNANHWIQLELIGTTSNRDGIGARVVATAGGKNQLRERNGGYHRWAQHHQRIHFGLGSNDVVDLDIRWPSGAVDSFMDVPADKLYAVTENGAIEEIELPTEIDPSPCGSAGGMPLYSPGFDQGIFMGKDCTTGEWQVRVTGGGDAVSYRGLVTSDQPFTNVTPVSVESNDTFDTTNPQAISFRLGVGGAGEDGFNFSSPDDGGVCFDADRPVGVTATVGGSGMEITPPFNLETLGPCGVVPPEPPVVSINDVTVSESDGSASFTVSLSEAGSQQITVDYASANGSAVAPDDYTAVSDTLTFATGETSKQVVVSIVDDGLAEGTETFTVSLSNPVNATLGTSTGTATLNDNDAPASCPGLPAYDKATERGVFIGCANGNWQVRVTGGGGTSVSFRGSLTSGSPFASATGVLVEASDTVTVTTDPAAIDYVLNVGGSGQDGINFSGGTGVCFNLDAPSGATVLVGSDRTPVSPPFDLTTLGPCGDVPPELPVVSINDVAVSESDGSASFTVSLSETDTQPITVDYASADGSAMAPDDYTAVSDTLTFAAGETSKAVVVAIVDDGLAESTETFTVSLSNPVNATLGTSTGTATLTDNDAPASCPGLPSYDKATERGVFIGCANGNWQVRVTGGGGTNVSFMGSVTSGQAFAGVTGFSIEASDTLDASTNPAAIDYILNVGGTGQDGFNFSGGTNVCFGLDAPTGATILVGTDRTPVSPPFDLATLGPCP